VADDVTTTVVEVLRGRVLRGLHAGTIAFGDRLPSTRDLASEFAVDHRLILAAYKQLAAEGLVEVRERGGVYVSGAHVTTTDAATLPVKWFADVFAEGFAREIPASELLEWLRRSVETLRLRAVVISSTIDQVTGLARELHHDFGLIAEGVVAEALTDPALESAALRRADVLIATSAHVDAARAIGAQLHKPVLGIEVRPDLVAGEWAMLLRQPVWAVVATRAFGEMLRAFFKDVRGAENLHVLVFGEDDLSVIPDGAPTYVTHRVREALSPGVVRGRILPAARTIATDSARAIFEFIVRSNLRALETIQADQAAGAPSKRA
jgi:DNA-binding transcriptional regulator YhcF (GntR family)